jgi:hypothetical protein
VPSTRPSSSAHRAAYFSLQSTAAAKQVHNTLTLIRLQAPGTLQGITMICVILGILVEEVFALPMALREILGHL